MTDIKWTKSLVQQHAQVAVAIEIYTLPFYFTALASLSDPSQILNDPTTVSGGIYQEILGVCIEEMLHLELAANLCIALGTKPKFTIPTFGVDFTTMVEIDQQFPPGLEPQS